VDSRDGAIKVKTSRSGAAAFAAELNLDLHRPADVLWQPKLTGELLDSPAPRAIDPRVELHGDGRRMAP